MYSMEIITLATWPLKTQYVGQQVMRCSTKLSSEGLVKTIVLNVTRVTREKADIESTWTKKMEDVAEVSMDQRGVRAVIGMERRETKRLLPVLVERASV